jgi:DNA helicase-2/ATP-dependent DNA helicase PcrA
MSFSPIDFRGELNDEQYAAVTAPDGPALVLAGAGSGKTRTLTYRVAFLILERRIDPRDLLLLTFTNKAAREMTERVMELTGSSYPPAWSGTFHSVGGRILRQHGEKIGLSANYTVLDASDSDSLIANVIKEDDKNFTKNKDNPKPKVIGDLISYARNTRTPLTTVVEERFPWHKSLPGAVDRFAMLYEKRKLEMQVADYDDLLVYWLKLLKENEDIRTFYQRKFRSVLVDEYQDTNSLQSEIVDLIAADHNLMAVGDDAQCIYTWRGANFENISSFSERHPGTTVYKIVKNYRSTPEILDLANSVLAAQPAGSGYSKDLVAHRESGVLPFVVPVMDTRQQAEFIISRIEGLYDQGISLGDIAVLYRAHFQALDLQLEFSRRGIPFVITSGVRFFEQAHIRDFVAQLRFVSNPQDVQALERLMCLLPKVGPATVNKVLKAAQKQVAAAQRANQAQAGTLFEGHGSAADDRLVMALAEDDVVSKIPADAREDYESMVASLIELADLMKEADDAPAPSVLIERAIEGWYGDFIKVAYTDADRRREDLESLVGFAQRFAAIPEMLAQLVLLNSETTDKGVELSDDVVRMTTVHQAKGLEYPVVFVISCADELFPLRRAIEEGDIEEERRLFYVAVTRAKDELYLTFPILNSGRGGSLRLDPSRFLMEIPTTKYERLGYRPTRW